MNAFGRIEMNTFMSLKMSIETSGLVQSDQIYFDTNSSTIHFLAVIIILLIDGVRQGLRQIKFCTNDNMSSTYL